jgi:hypothetical protein
VERFAPVLRDPVITDLSLPSGWTTADGSKLRNLVDGDDVVVPISASKDAAQFALTGKRPDGSPWEMVRTENILPGAGLVWARARVRYLDSKGRRSDSLAVAKEFNILSEQAAFVAWDEAEKVPVAQTELFQPGIAVAENVEVRYSLRDPASYCAYDAAPAPEPPEDRMMRGGPMSPPTKRSKKAPKKSPAGNSNEQLVAYLVRLQEDLQRFWDPQPVPQRLQEIFQELKALLGSTDEEHFNERVTSLLEALVKELHDIRSQEHNLLRKLRLMAGLNRRAEEALHLFQSKPTPVHP